MSSGGAGQGSSFAMPNASQFISAQFATLNFQPMRRWVYSPSFPSGEHWESRIEHSRIEALTDFFVYFEPRTVSILSPAMTERISTKGGPLRVVVLISGSLLFERGTDLSPLKWEGDCNCRLYHVRLRVNREDLFDHLQKLIEPLRPRTFNVYSASEFRKALAEIVLDLNKL